MAVDIKIKIYDTSLYSTISVTMEQIEYPDSSKGRAAKFPETGDGVKYWPMLKMRLLNETASHYGLEKHTHEKNTTT